MRLRVPLYGKVLFWFFVNLALVAALAFGFVRMEFKLGMEWLLAGPAGQRLEAMSEVITADLRERPPYRWNEVLERYHDAHGVTFAIFRNDARQIAGPELNPPAPVEEKLRDRRGPPNPRTPKQKNPKEANPAVAPPAPPPARSAFFLRAGEPAKYWAGVHIGLTHADPVDPRPVTLLVVSDSITGGGLFFEPLPWVAFMAAAVALSALVWLPIVGGITRAIRRVNTAAREIARGRFDVRVPEQRRDELGELGGSLNTMAARLGEYVAQQQRLTADVAHELCSPIARMQRALGIVEQRGIAKPGQLELAQPRLFVAAPGLVEVERRDEQIAVAFEHQVRGQADRGAVVQRRDDPLARDRFEQRQPVVGHGGHCRSRGRMLRCSIVLQVAWTCKRGAMLVGERGFEPPAPASRRQCSTRLSYSPTDHRPPERGKAGGRL